MPVLDWPPMSVKKRKPLRGRPSKGRKALTRNIPIKFSDEQLETLDVKRGETPRMTYVREKALS